MSDSLKYNMKLDNFAKSLKATVADLKFAAGKALNQEAETIMRISKQKYVPVATGVLRASGFVEPSIVKGNFVSIKFGFGGPAQAYALRVHENPRAGKTDGKSPKGKKYPRTKGGKAKWSQVGQWKYLETPLKERKPKLSSNLAKIMKRLLKAKKK